MPLISVSSGPIGKRYHGNALDLEMRVYCRKTFVASSGTPILKGNPDSEDFYQKVTCFFDVNGDVHYNDFAIDSTEDGEPLDSYYTILLYTATGERVELIADKIKIPVTPTSTTLKDLMTYNDAKCKELPNTYLTARQIYALFASLVNMAFKMTTVIFGAGRLNYPALAQDDPIVVSDYHPTWRALNDSHFLEFYGHTQTGINNALTAIGSSPGKLKITKRVAITDDTTIPANIQVIFDGDDSGLTIPTGKTVRINSMRDPGDVKVFYTSGTGKVVLGKGAIKTLNLAHWAGFGSGLNDNAAMAQLVASITLNGGGDVWVPAATYYCDSDALLLTQTESNCHFRGAGAAIDGDGHGGTVLKIIDPTGTKAVMKTFQSVSQMVFQDICFDVGTSITAQCVLIDGIQGNGSLLNIKFQDCVIHGNGSVPIDYTHATPLMDVFSEGVNTDWEAVGISLVNTYFTLGTNCVGLRTNTVNSSLDLIHPFFEGNPGSVGWLANDSGWCTVINMDGRATGATYGVGVTETLHRNQTLVNVIFGTDTFKPSDINLSDSTIYIDQFVPYQGDRVRFTTTGSLAGTGISPGVDYYVKSFNADRKRIQLALTSDSLANVVSLTGQGTGNHTITVNGTQHVSITPGAGTLFSMDDMTQKCIIGSLDTYFLDVLGEYDAITYHLITAPATNTTMSIYRQSPGTGLMYAAIVFAGNRGQTMIKGGATEGILYPLIFKNTTTEVYNQIDVDGFQPIGARIKFEGTIIYNHSNCTYHSNAFTQSGGLGPIIVDGGGNVVEHVSIYRSPGNESGFGTRLLRKGYLYGDNMNSWRNPSECLLTETDRFSNEFSPQMDSVKISHLQPSGDADNTKALIELGTSLSQAGGIDRLLFWLGQIDPVSKRRKNGYGFTRSGTTGWLTITGDQVLGQYRGVEFKDPIRNALTLDADTTLTKSLRATAKGASNGIGYGLGAGDITVVQTGSRTNPVTCNAFSGYIATYNGSGLIPAQSFVDFIFYNNCVEQSDVPYVCQQGLANYLEPSVIEVGLGYFKVRVKNISPTNADGSACYIKFIVWKGAHA